jgi:hypothetical protein
MELKENALLCSFGKLQFIPFLYFGVVVINWSPLFTKACSFPSTLARTGLGLNFGFW